MTAGPEEGASPLDPVPMAPVPPPERRSRAGRNLPAAVAVGLGLGAVVLASLYIWKPAFLVVIVAAVFLAVIELAHAFAADGVRFPVPPVVVGAVAVVVGAYAGGSDGLVAAVALTLFATMIWRARGATAGYVRDVTAGAFTVLYIPVLASFAALLLRQEDGADRAVLFIILTVLSDVGGYAAGVLFGRHPMAPSISPKKSWEGAAGSALFCAVGGAIAIPTMIDGRAVYGVLIGLAVMVAATLGDLGESMIKRDLGIKDMGSLLPGHGGVLDRLDSLLPAAPVTFLLIGWLVPVVSP